MQIFLDKILIKKDYNISLVRILSFLFFFLSLLVGVYRTVSLSLGSIITIFLIAAFVFIFSYLVEILIFYLVFKKHLSGFKMAEKQIAPLIFVEWFLFLLLSILQLFIEIPNIRLFNLALNQILPVIYIGYLIHKNTFQSKCYTCGVVYILINLLLVLPNIMTNLMSSGFVI